MNVKFSSVDACQVISITGDINHFSAVDFANKIGRLSGSGKILVALDITRVGYFSIECHRLVLEFIRKIRSLGGDVRFACSDPDVARSLRQTLGHFVKLYGSLPGVVESFRVDPPRVAADKDTDRWRDADTFLDRMRLIGDPLADDVVRDLYENNQISSVNDIMQSLVKNQESPAKDLPRAMRRYLELTTELPGWADNKRIEHAQDVFGMYGLHIGTILHCASLPLAYCAVKGVHVLAQTERISNNTYRRIFETTQMVMDLMAPQGMKPRGYGLRTVQKVRLMHAAIRLHLLEKGDWDLDYYGYPINQEDLAGTLMTFSHVPVSRLPNLGVTLKDSDKEDYIHAWNVVGHMTGILPEMLPGDSLDHENLYHKILSRHAAESEEGKVLTSTLLSAIHANLPSKVKMELPEALIRDLSGDKYADMLGVPATSWQKALKVMQIPNLIMDKLDDKFPILAKMSEFFTRSLMQGLIKSKLEGQRPDFRMPESLRDEVRIEPDSLENR